MAEDETRDGSTSAAPRHPTVSVIQLDPTTLETIILGMTAQLRATGGGGECTRADPPPPMERGEFATLGQLCFPMQALFQPGGGCETYREGKQLQSRAESRPSN